MSFVVLGDFGVGGVTERDVARAIRDFTDVRDVTALITTGDNIYDRGHPSEFQRGWWDHYHWVRANGIDVIAALGNHDAATRGGRPVMELFEMPARWYSKRYGDAEIFVLDSTRPEDPEQLRYMRGMRDSDARWKIVTFHHPAFSCGLHGTTEKINRIWVPLLEDAGAHVVLNGHDHNYQRFDPVDGVRYFVTGGGGARLYPVLGCKQGTEPPAVAKVVYHFVHLRVRPEGIYVEAVSKDGEVFDRLIILA